MLLDLCAVMILSPLSIIQRGSLWPPPQCPDLQWGEPDLGLSMSHGLCARCPATETRTQASPPRRAGDGRGEETERNERSWRKVKESAQSSSSQSHVRTHTGDQATLATSLHLHCSLKENGHTGEPSLRILTLESSEKPFVFHVDTCLHPNSPDFYLRALRVTSRVRTCVSVPASTPRFF